MRVGVRTELDLFDFDCLLLLAGLGFALLLFVLELAEIHDLTDRRIGIGRDLDQIQTCILCHNKRARRGYDPNVFAVGANQADFRAPDAIIDAWAGVARRGRVMRSAGYGAIPSVVSLNYGGET